VVALADTGAEGLDRADRINTTQVARVVHAEVNAERRARGLPAYERRPGAATAAANHAGWLADTGRLKHQPDRYTCGPGANIAYTYANRDVKTGWGEVANHHNNETAIGQYLVKQWLHSPPHREHLLSERYTGHGVGVAVGEINGSVRVYAAEAFCI
jgi:uncharacterized protein YkwD